MGLLDEIRDDLVNESVGLSNTLRKAKILASRLGVSEFRDWLHFELNGYPDEDKTPQYRRFRPVNMGTFHGPLQSQMKNVVLPTYNLPDWVRDFAENFVFLEGVGHLEGIVAADSDSFRRRWPQELLMVARKYINLSGEMVLVDAEQPLPIHVVSGIIDKIKNVLLDFILDLQENEVAPEEMESDTETRQVVRNLFEFNIYGGHNVVAGGENVHQTTTLVQKGNRKSLLNHLRKREISENDLGELKDAISSERRAPKGELGPKVGGWVGSMMSKAATGIWKVSVETASKFLSGNCRFGPMRAAAGPWRHVQSG